MTPIEEMKFWQIKALARIEWLQRVYDLPWWKRLPVMWADSLRYRLIERPMRWLGWQ